ncbi:GNAT family N-acetyltransferase [Amycolatopsis sp. NPDC005232]|uniref:GNAT family N-acetyltransferase n=1 Tax=Amycolatopsis sp. NPDC005232 TaxID=3157027 RepID=UPI0033B5CBE5
MNGVFGIAENASVVEMAEFAAQMPRYGVPWVLRTRGAATPEFTELAESHGRTVQDQRALAVLEKNTPPFDTTPPGATVRRVDGAHAQTFLDVSVAATGVLADSVRDLLSAAVLDLPAASPYVVEVGGEVVAVGLGLRGADLVAPYFLFTLPAHAGRGYDTLVTARILHDAFDNGARGGLLAIDPTNEQLARTLGFRTVDTWTTAHA